MPNAISLVRAFSFRWCKMAADNDHISMTCSRCATKLRVDAKFRGRMVKCPGCGEVSEVQEDEICRPTAAKNGSIVITCFGCGTESRESASLCGRIKKCLKCGEIFRIHPDDHPERMLEIWFSKQMPFAQKPIHRIVHFIDRTTSTLDIAMYSMTHDWLIPALQKALDRGVQIRMILDRQQAGCKDSDDEKYARMGIPVALDTNSGLMHHKFAIRDRKTVLTGSYNWTKSAEENHRENFLVIHYEHAVKEFEVEFDRLWIDNMGGVITG